MGIGEIQDYSELNVLAGEYTLPEFIDVIRADMIDLAILVAEGNKAEAAKMLGIPRATLYMYLDNQKIEPPKGRWQRLILERARLQSKLSMLDFYLGRAIKK